MKWKTLGFLMLLLFSSTAFAALPFTLSYQGYITNSSGGKVNGTVQMTFRLYDAAEGGNLQWDSGPLNVIVENGIYNVVLGDQTSSQPPIDPDIFNDQLYLGVQLEGEDEMVPRLVLTSVGQAMIAYKAVSVADESVTNAQIAGVISVSKLPVGTTSDTVAAGDHSHPALDSRITTLEAAMADVQGQLADIENQLAASNSNGTPLANSGADQVVAAGALVTLDGSNSSDPDGDPLSYSWTLTTVPEGSAAILSNPAAVNPSFTADIAGLYSAALVVNDGLVNSATDSVNVTAVAGNEPPVADAGSDQNVLVGSVVSLDGSGSLDPDSAPLTYTWAISARPEGSTAVLSNQGAINPTFTADLVGQYEISLVVNDGTFDSIADSVQVGAANYDFGVMDQSSIVLSSPCDTSAGTTIIGGNIINQAWTAAGSPYYLAGDITIPAGSTLSIGPGVTVCTAATDAMASGKNINQVEITVNGTLTVAGDADLPVIFRSSDVVSGVAWYGIVFDSGSTGNTIDFAFITNAARGIDSSGPLVVKRSVFMNNTYGAYLSASETIDASVFLENDYGVRANGNQQLSNLLAYRNTYGLYLNMPIDLNVSNCTIDANSNYGIYISSTTGNVVSILNSLVTNNGTYGIYKNTTNGAATLSGTNVWGNGSNLYQVSGTGTISSNPLYVGAPFSYKLSPGSPSIDAGIDLSGSVPADILGISRPQDGDGISGASYDIGAYEM